MGRHELTQINTKILARCRKCKMAGMQTADEDGLQIRITIMSKTGEYEWGLKAPWACPDLLDTDFFGLFMDESFARSAQETDSPEHCGGVLGYKRFRYNRRQQRVPGNEFG